MKKLKVRSNKLEVNLMQAGQALVTLLVFVSIAIMTTTAAVLVVLINTQSTETVAIGEQAHAMAEAGIEEGLLKVLRNPAYTGNETLSIAGGSVNLTISGSSSKVITSEGVIGGVSRKLEVAVSITNNIQQITAWNEID